MKYIYSCEEFNRNNVHNGLIIADESDLISSTAYLHTFFDEKNNENYSVVSDNIGISMPNEREDNEFWIGTSQYVYFFDVVLKEMKYKKALPSPCVQLLIALDKVLVICETDVVVVYRKDECFVTEFTFDDIIIDCKISNDCLTVYFFEGGERKIDI